MIIYEQLRVSMWTTVDGHCIHGAIREWDQHTYTKQPKWSRSESSTFLSHFLLQPKSTAWILDKPQWKINWWFGLVFVCVSLCPSAPLSSTQGVPVRVHWDLPTLLYRSEHKTLMWGKRTPRVGIWSLFRVTFICLWYKGLLTFDISPCFQWREELRQSSASGGLD